MFKRLLTLAITVILISNVAIGCSEKEAEAKTVFNIDKDYIDMLNGKQFSISASNAALADDASISNFLTTTSGKEVITKIKVASDGNGTLTIHEDPTIGTAGSASTMYNTNRGSSNTAVTTGVTNANMATTGTTILTDVVGADTNYSVRRVFDNSSFYGVRFQNKSGGAANCSLTIEYTEDTA